MKIRKLFVLLMIAIVVTVLGACNNESNSNTISIAELTEKEIGIFSTVADKSFVFDFNVDDEYEETSVWVEKYEFGELVESKLSHITAAVEETGSIIFAASKNEKQNVINIGINGNGDTASKSDFDNDLEEMASVWGNFEGEKTLNEGEIVLANICYSSDENGMSSLTNDFYDDVEGHMNELEEYDVVYLLKAEFVK